MIDSHKYNGEAKVAVFGEPDFVISTVRMCVENGIMPFITPPVRISNVESFVGGRDSNGSGRILLSGI